MLPTKRSHRSRPGRVAAAFLAVLVACEASGSSCIDCTGVVPYPDPPPPAGEVQNDVVRARLTQSALDFLREHLDVLLTQFLVVEGNRGKFFLDPALFGASPIVVRPNSFIAFDLDELSESLTLEWAAGPNPEDPPRLRFALEQISFYLDGIVGIDVDLFPPAACHLQDAAGQPAITIERLQFDVALGVDGSGPLPTFSGNIVPDSVDVVLLGATESSFLALEVNPCDGSVVGDLACATPDALCVLGDSNCPDVCQILDLFTQLGGFLAILIEPIIDGFAPELAGFVSDALIGALNGLPLGLETQINLAGMLGPLFSHAGPLHLKLAASDDVKLAGSFAGFGLDLGMRGGAAAALPAVCAAGATPPDLSALRGEAPEMTGFVEVLVPGSEPPTTRIERYDASLTLSEALVSQAFWGAYQTGLLCLGLDSYDIETLVGDTFTFNAGLLLNFDARLVGITPLEAPMLATIRPTQPPALRLGVGGPVATGVEDPLLELTVNNVEIGIYMLLDDTMVRVTMLNADLIVRLGIERTSAGAIELALEDFAVGDLRQLYNEMAPASDLSGLFEVVVDIALDTFLGDNLKFEFDLGDTLSSALGMPIGMALNAIRRDEGADGARYLSVYLSLCDESDAADVDSACYGVTLPGPPPPPPQAGAKADTAFRADLDAESLYVPADPARYDPERWLAAPSGELRVEVGEPGDDGWEYQTRVDGGLWRTFVPAIDGELRVSDARLRLVGAHVLELRRRKLASPTTLSASVELGFFVDRERPALFARDTGDGFVDAEVEDLGSADATRLLGRLDEGVWQELLSPIDVRSATSLELVAADLAGNLSEPRRFSWGTTAPAIGATDQDSPETRGCAASVPSGLGLLVAVVLLGRRRRLGAGRH